MIDPKDLMDMYAKYAADLRRGLVEHIESEQKIAANLEEVKQAKCAIQANLNLMNRLMQELQVLLQRPQLRSQAQPPQQQVTEAKEPAKGIPHPA